MSNDKVKEKSGFLYNAIKGIQNDATFKLNDDDSNELFKIVITHAATAGVSAMATGILPGAGAIVADGISIAAIWSMYVRFMK